MSSHSFKLWSIMRDVRSENPAKRYKALFKLNELKEKETAPRGIVLEKLVKEAARPFPEPVDVWDDPSYHLLRFVSDFYEDDLAQLMIDNYNGFSVNAKGEVVRYLCELSGEKYRVLICDYLEASLKDNTAILPLDALFDEPNLVRRIVQNFYTYIENDFYKYEFYRMLLFCLRNESIIPFKHKYIVPLLIEDFKKLKEDYLQYDSSYDPKFVYNNWKENYLAIRSNFEVLLSLIEFYYSDDFVGTLKEAMTFKDPQIKTRAAIISLQKQIDVEEKILFECATNVETSELLYWELLRIHKEHLFPIKENKQHYFAKSHLFNLVIDNSNELSYPDQIEIIEKIFTTNYYGQGIRYYFISFIHEDEKKLAWVGGYGIDDEDDSIYMWEGTYIDQNKFSDYSIQEHIQNFLYDRKEMIKEIEETVEFTSRPPIFKMNLFIAAIYCYFTFASWGGYFLENDMNSLRFGIVMAIIGTVFITWRIIRYNKVKVELKTFTLSYHNGFKTKEVQINHINKILNRKSPILTRIFKRQPKTILIYNEENELILKIPANYVNYEEFSKELYSGTLHLSEQPYIEEAS
ncbi:hypothetical protein J5Y03_00595 [Bacillus sp. RG28]|uniref:Uncharacterized protein n=1 Tax=Gottfriedia endophytica TaxID=2820819 RepID=A0A940SH80_9BACI|nr:hypothetical protein [Gottfriedia endophytica]MBP0723680.1 hypothetical protein [Gottfriedia endophytica]